MDVSAVLRGTLGSGVVKAGLIHRLGRWCLAAVAGAFLAVVLFMLFYRIGGLASVAPPLVLTGAKLQLVQGEGEPTPSGLLIRRSGAQGRAVVQAAARRAPASLYGQVAWRLDGATSEQDLQLAWVTLAAPHTVRTRPLPHQTAGVLDMTAEPHWQGRILALGLIVSGPLTQPIRLDRLELRPVMPSWATLGRELVADWTAFEPWSQRSINFAADAPLNALFPPVSLVLLALLLSAAGYAVLEPPRRTPNALWPYVALFLLGWLILDLRWQWTLSQRLEQTAADFAGKSPAQRWQVLDEALYPFLQAVRNQLPASAPVSTRLFIISADPTGFEAGRTRYHLLPYNSHLGFTGLPPSDAVRSDDYLLLLAPLEHLRYDSTHHVLEQGSLRLPVTLRYRAELGGLFQVRDRNVQEP